MATNKSTLCQFDPVLFGSFYPALLSTKASLAYALSQPSSCTSNRRLFIIGWLRIENWRVDMISYCTNLLDCTRFCKSSGSKFYNIRGSGYFILKEQCLWAITFQTTSSMIISTFYLFDQFIISYRFIFYIVVGFDYD